MIKSLTMKMMMVFIIVFFNSSIVFSQHPPCYQDYEGLTFSAEKLPYVPPMDTDMPLDAMIGYIAADSARHNATYDEMIDFLERQTYNDTIKYIMRYYYQMVDWNPINFHLYRDYGDSQSCHLLRMEDEVEKKILELDTTYGNVLLVHSDIIAHVRVVDTIRHYDSSAGIYNRAMIVTSEILDTMKGRVIPSCNNYNQYINKNRKDKQFSIPNECLQFEYALDWPRGEADVDGVYIGEDGYPWTGLYPKLIDSTGTPWIKKNKEYIVFLVMVTVCFDRDNETHYYTLFAAGEGSMTYGMYPIIDGKVYDPENEFGFGNNLTVEEFKNALNNRIQEITTYGE